MTEKIVPLYPTGTEYSVLARIDVVAMDLLAGGQATNLQMARGDAILADLRLQRDEMTSVLAELRQGEPTGVDQIDAAYARLIAAIDQGVVQIDLFIAHALSLLDEIIHSGTAQSGSLAQPSDG